MLSAELKDILRQLGIGFLLIVFAFSTRGQGIRISVFNSTPVKGVIIASYVGKYSVYNGSVRVMSIDGDENLYITLYNKRLLLNCAGGTIGVFDSLCFREGNESSRLKVTPFEPRVKGRIYTNQMILKIEYGRILLINLVEPEQYIAGVVEAEGGVNAEPEFWKAQALLCRTYLYSHLNRHESEGFNLCDEVHCQAFKGMSPFTPNIFKSTSINKKKVIVGSDNQLITASFHANCGGETESSGNTWLKASENSTPLKDPYCLQMKNSNWTKEIPLQEWKAFLKNNGLGADKVAVRNLEMLKSGRQHYYVLGQDSIPLQKIRENWSLKSSFFQVKVKNSQVILTGHGYGHGVGLCQDGASMMARKGFSCNEIIGFYFKNVKIIDYTPDQEKP